MITKERNTEKFAFSIELGRPLDKEPLIRGSREPLSGIQCEINFIDVGKDIRDEFYNEIENFKASLQGMACQWRYLKLKERLEANKESIPEKELEAKYSRACERMMMREIAELEKQMEAAKLPQEETASKRPDFVGESNIKLKEDVEEFLAMSQEKFEEMVQNYLKSAPRCKFAEGNGSDSTSKSPASKQERLLAKLKKKLYKRADMEVEAARMISEGRMEDALRLLHRLDRNSIKKTLKKLI